MQRGLRHGLSVVFGEGELITVEDAMGILGKLTATQIWAYMRGHLSREQADAFDVLTANVGKDVLVLLSARAVARLPDYRAGSATTTT